MYGRNAPVYRDGIDKGSTAQDLEVLLDFLTAFPILGEKYGWKKSLTPNTDLVSLRKDHTGALGVVHADATKLEGISINERGRVTMIHLGRHGLEGDLPLSLRNLKELEELRIDSNLLTGKLRLIPFPLLPVVLKSCVTQASFPKHWDTPASEN